MSSYPGDARFAAEAAERTVAALASRRPAPSPWEGLAPSCRRASTALQELGNARLNIAVMPRKPGYLDALRAARLKAVSTLAEVARLAVLAEALLPADVVLLGEIIADGAEDRAVDWKAAISLRCLADHLDGVGGVDERKTEPGPAPVLEGGEDEDEGRDGPLSLRDGGHRPAIECKAWRP